jgi:putative membrane protein
MSPARKPAAFRVDDPQVVLMPPSEAEVPVVEAVTPPALPVRRARLPWAALFWSAVFGLTVLGLGLAVVNLIEELYSRVDWLGYLGAALAALAVLALAAVSIRETIAFVRLTAIDRIRDRAAATIESDDRAEGAAVVRDLLALTRRAPSLARARVQLENHLGDIIDGRDLVHLAERRLMSPLDAQARRLVSAAATRVSIVTAVSPRAAVDMFFVLATALGLVRQLALLYGGRPGAFGLIRLVRHAVAHLAVTGGIAVGDGLIQQVIGHGVVAKLSARLGEGVLNGLLTARLGLAAIEVTRPLPFAALRRPSMNDLAGALLRAQEGAAQPELAHETGSPPA